jgi:hypothetical protein
MKQLLFYFNRLYTPVGFGLLNSAGRFLQSAVASGTSNPQLGGPVIRTFQLPTQASPSSGRWNYGREMAESFAESGDFHVKLRRGTDGFTSPPKEGVLRIFSPEKSDGLDRFEPANSGTKVQHATSRPPKQ